MGWRGAHPTCSHAPKERVVVAVVVLLRFAVTQVRTTRALRIEEHSKCRKPRPSNQDPRSGICFSSCDSRRSMRHRDGDRCGDIHTRCARTTYNRINLEDVLRARARAYPDGFICDSRNCARLNTGLIKDVTNVTDITLDIFCTFIYAP